VIISKKIQLLFFELFSVGPAMNLRYSSSKVIGNFPAVLSFNQLFLKLNWIISN
jgi:hypothetical protein